MTTAQILVELRKAGKPVQIAQLYRYFHKFNIQPQGCLQRPQQYPPDTACRILFGLGHTQPINGKQSASRGKEKAPRGANGESSAKNNQVKGRLTPTLAASRSVLTMKQLRAERAKARGTK
jgi:hypothetical protein